jgi:hypothetical protein
MNKLHIILILLVSISFFSCETDVDVAAEYKDITIVYGIINPDETTHYLKINKAFLGNVNALDLASDAGNSNYPDGELEITVQACDENGTVKKTYSTGAGTVVKSVGEIIKEPGIFDSNSNVLYKFEEASINRDYTYKLKIINKRLDKEISTETTIVNSSSVSNPSRNSKFQFWNGAVSDADSYVNKKFGLTTGADIGRVGLVLFFNYTQHYTTASSKSSTTHLVKMSLIDVQTTRISGNEGLEWALEGEIFFENIASTVSSPTTVADFSHRELKNITLQFSVAGTELNTYMEVNAPSSSVNQDRPGYTNITNGLGVFSSRDKMYWESSIDPVSQNQVNINDLTIAKLDAMNLGFCFGTTGVGFPKAACQQL